MKHEKRILNLLYLGLVTVILAVSALLISACMSPVVQVSTSSPTGTDMPALTDAVGGSQSAPSSVTETMTPVVTPTPATSETPTETATPAEMPTSTETATAAATASATATPANPYAMESLLNRAYTGGEIVREAVLQENSAYTSYLISYPSDGLKIYGVMKIPAGKGPFPVIVMNHGHYDPVTYISGSGTDTMADILARSGYLTLASDYRGHGKSGGSPASAGERTAYGVDVLNLIASIPSIPEADGSRIGMWGHSMGGEVSMVVAEVSKQIKASVVWAPTSGDAIVNGNFYSGHGGAQETLDGATSAAESPLYFVDHVSAPIGLHQGDIDTDVDPQWAIRWRDALQAAGKQVEFYWYPGQGHNFRELGWGVISPRTVEFYDRYVK